MTIDQQDGQELWKLSRYFDNVHFWSEPGVKDVTVQPIGHPANGQQSINMTYVKTVPYPDEYEMYNLTKDPLETCNLAHPAFATQYSIGIQQQMMMMLEEQRVHKRLYPNQPSAK
jgi:hypothetical protein